MQIKLIDEVVMNDSRPASNSVRATHYFVRTFIVDYLVKWGNFNILNIKLQGLGNKLKKKKLWGSGCFFCSIPLRQGTKYDFLCVKIGVLSLLMRCFKEDRKHGIPLSPCTLPH